MFEVAFFAVIVLIVVFAMYATWCDYSRERNVINQARNKLRGTKFVVAIRMKDGGRNYWETLFIKQLMDLGAIVLDISPEEGSRLWVGDRTRIPPGALVFVGTTWEKAGIYFIDGKFLPKMEKDQVENGQILAPFYSCHRDAATLSMNIAESVVQYL